MSDEEDSGSPRLSDIEHEVDNLRKRVNGLVVKVEKKRLNLETFISLLKVEETANEEILPKLASVEQNLLETGSGKDEFENFKTKLRERQKAISETLPRLKQLLEEVLEKEPKVKDFVAKAQILYKDDSNEGNEEEIEKLKRENDEWWNAIREQFEESKKLRNSLLKRKDDNLVQEFESWERGSSLLKEAKANLSQINKELNIKSDIVDDLTLKIASLELRAADAEKHSEEIRILSLKLESLEDEKINKEKELDSYKKLMEDTKQLAENLELRNTKLAEDLANKNNKSKTLESEIDKLKKQFEEEKQSRLDVNSQIEQLEEKLKKEKEENEEWLKLVEVLKSKLNREEANNAKIEEENKVMKERILGLEIQAAELKKCKHEIEELLNRNDNNEKEKITLKKQLEEYKNIVNNSKELVSTLELQNNKLTDDVAEENKKSTSLRIEINQLEDELNKEKEASRNHRDEIEQLKESLKDERDESAKWIREVEVLKGKITKEEAFDKEIASLKENLEDKERKLDETRKELETMCDKHKEIEKALLEKERQVEDTKENLQQTEDALESEKLVKDEYTIKCEILENKLSLVESENKELKEKAIINENSQIKEKEKVKTLQNEVGNQTKINKSLKDQISSLEAQIDYFEERTKEIIKLENETELKEKEKKSLGIEVDNYKQLLEEHKNLATETEQRNQALSKDIERESTRATNLTLQINKLENQLYEEKENSRDKKYEIEKLQEALENEKDKNAKYMREVEALKGKINKEEALNKDIAYLNEELESKGKKLEETRQELETMHDKHKVNESALAQKEKQLENTQVKLEVAEEALEYEKLVNDEYTIKCEKLEHDLSLLESENKELKNAASIQESSLKQEKDKVQKLQNELEEIKTKNEDLRGEITELNEQLIAAEANDKQNQQIQLRSLEKLKSVENENQQLLEITENLKENINEKEKGIQELVERYAIEEQKLNQDIQNVTRELQIFKNDCITKSQVIDDLREQLDNGSTEKVSSPIVDELEALQKRNREMGVAVASLETDLIKERERNEKFEESILELNTRYDEAEEKYEVFDREASEELDRKDAQIEDLARKVEEEQDRSYQLELQLSNLKEITDIIDELSDPKGLNKKKAELLKSRLKAVKEEFESNEIQRRDEKIVQLEDELERMNELLRDEQCQSAEKDEIISDFKDTGLKDRQMITDYSEEITELREEVRVKNQHIEELTEKVLENQILVMDLQSEAESERARAATIEELLTAEKGRYFHQITIVHDLKKKVEEYQSTVGEIKSKVDRINRHLRCLPQATLDGSKSVSTEDLSARKVSQKLTSQRLSLKDIKTTVAAVEGKHEKLLQEVHKENAKNTDQDERIEELVNKTAEYDAVMDEMKVELDKIKKRYEDICYRLQYEDEVDSYLLEKEKVYITASMQELKGQLLQLENTLEMIFLKEAKRIDTTNEKLEKVMSKNMDFIKKLKTVKIKSYEDVIEGMSKELEEERKVNADLTETVIKDLQENFKENQERLREVSRKADENEKRRQEMSRQFSIEKKEQELKIKELMKIMNDNKEVVNELKFDLEKEQQTVFELTEELTIEKSDALEKNAFIEELKANLAKEKETHNTLKRSLDEESERSLQLSAALTAEQVKGVKREEKIKTAESLIAQVKENLEENEEKVRELEEELNDTKNQNNQLTKLIEEEVVVCTQVRENFKAEQAEKTKYEQEKDHLLHLNKKLTSEIEQQNAQLHEAEDKISELEQEKSHRENLIEALKTALESEGQNYTVLASRLETEESQKIELETKLKATEKLQDEMKTVVLMKERETKMKEDELKELLTRLDDEHSRVGNLLEGEKQKNYELYINLDEEKRKNVDKEKALSDMFEHLAEERVRNEELEELVCQLQKKVSDNKLLLETLIEQNERDGEEKRERDSRTGELELLLDEWKKKFMEQNQEVELLRGVYLQNDEIRKELQSLAREKQKYQNECEHNEKVLFELELRCTEQGKEIEYEKSRYEQLRADMEQKEQIMEENNKELTDIKRQMNSKEEDIQMATTRVENLKQNLDLISIESEEKAKALKQKEKALRKAGKKITKDLQIVGTIKQDLAQKFAERELKVQKLEKSVELLKRLYLATKIELKRLEAAENVRLRRNNKNDKASSDEEGEIVMKDVREKIRDLADEIQCKEGAVQSLEEDIRESKNLTHTNRKELKRKENLLTVFRSQLRERIKQKARQEKLLKSLEDLYGDDPYTDDRANSPWVTDGIDILDSNLSSTTKEVLAKSSNKDRLIISSNNNNKQISKEPGFIVVEEESILEELKSSMDRSEVPVSEKIAIVETVSVECPLPSSCGIFQSVDGSSDESDIEMGDDDVFEDNPVREETIKDIFDKAKNVNLMKEQDNERQPEDTKTKTPRVSSDGKHKKITLYIVLALTVLLLPNILPNKVASFVLASAVLPIVFLIAKLTEKQQQIDFEDGLKLSESGLEGYKKSQDEIKRLQDELRLKNQENDRQQEIIDEMKLQIDTDVKLIEQIKGQLEEEIAEKDDKLNTKSEDDLDDLQKVVEMLETRLSEAERAKLEEVKKNQVTLKEYQELRNNIEQMRQEREAVKNQEQRKYQKPDVKVAKEIPKLYKINLPILALPIIAGISLGLFHYISQASFLALQATFCCTVLFAANILMSIKRIKNTLLEERKELQQQNEELDDILEILDREYEVVKAQKVAIDSLVKELDDGQVNRKIKQKELAKLIWELQEMEGLKKCIPKKTDGAGKQDLDLNLKIQKIAEEKALEKAQFYENMITRLQKIGSEDEEDQVLVDDLCDAAKELSVHAENTMKDVKQIKETLTEDKKEPKKKFSLKSIALGLFNAAALLASLAFQSKFMFGGVIAAEVLIYLVVKLRSNSESARILKLQSKLEQQMRHNKIQKSEIEKLKKLLRTEKSYKRSDEFATEVKQRRLKKKN